MTLPRERGARVSGSPCRLALALTALSQLRKTTNLTGFATLSPPQRDQRPRREFLPCCFLPLSRRGSELTTDTVHKGGRSPHKLSCESDWPHQKPQPEGLMSGSGNSSAVPGVLAVVRRTQGDRGQNPGPGAGVGAPALPPLLVLMQGVWRPRRLGAIKGLGT